MALYELNPLKKVLRNQTWDLEMSTLQSSNPTSLVFLVYLGIGFVSHKRVCNFSPWKSWLRGLQFCPYKNCNCEKIERICNLSKKIVWEGLQFSLVKIVGLLIGILLRDCGCRYEMSNHNLMFFFHFYFFYGCGSICLEISYWWFSQ